MDIKPVFLLLITLQPMILQISMPYSSYLEISAVIFRDYVAVDSQTSIIFNICNYLSNHKCPSSLGQSKISAILYTPDKTCIEVSSSIQPSASFLSSEG